jgi:leucyl aminopeptidase (aminopeptidase T)
MLVPGMPFSSSRVDITAGAAQAPDFFNQGFGFMNDGTLAVDTNVPAGSNFTKGIRQSAAGAVYGTTTAAGTDLWLEGIRITTLGQIVYESAAATGFASGNPITSNGRFAVI